MSYRFRNWLTNAAAGLTVVGILLAGVFAAVVVIGWLWMALCCL